MREPLKDLEFKNQRLQDEIRYLKKQLVIKQTLLVIYTLTICIAALILGII